MNNFSLIIIYIFVRILDLDTIFYNITAKEADLHLYLKNLM